MDTTQCTWNSSEAKTLPDCGNGKACSDRSFYGPPEPKLMNNLYSILALSLIFYERITRPSGHGTEENTLTSLRGPGLES